MLNKLSLYNKFGNQI